MLHEDISKENYLLRYGQYADFERIIDGEYGLIGDRLKSAITGHFRKGSVVRCLDVGCGTGRMPATLLKLLEGTGLTLVFDYMDPSKQALDMYEQTIAPGYRKNRFEQDWAQFQSPTRYDLILANNSLCGMDSSRRENMTRINDLLDDDGMALITLPSSRSDWVKFARELWDGVHHKPFPKTVFEDVTTALTRYGLAHNNVWIDAPVALGTDNDDAILRTVFSVMMYADREKIDESYPGQYASFKNNVLNRKDKRLNFVYGVTEIIK